MQEFEVIKAEYEMKVLFQSCKNMTFGPNSTQKFYEQRIFSSPYKQTTSSFPNQHGTLTQNKSKLENSDIIGQNGSLSTTGKSAFMCLEGHGFEMWKQLLAEMQDKVGNKTLVVQSFPRPRIAGAQCIDLPLFFWGKGRIYPPTIVNGMCIPLVILLVHQYSYRPNFGTYISFTLTEIYVSQS